MKHGIRSYLHRRRSLVTIHVADDDIRLTWRKGWFELSPTEQDAQLARLSFFLRDTTQRDRAAHKGNNEKS